MQLHLFKYLFLCPLNLLHVLDFPVFHPDLVKNLNDINGSKIYENKDTDIYSIRTEHYLYYISQTYYEIILQRRLELKKLGLIENDEKWDADLKLIDMTHDEDFTNLLYVNRKRQRNELKKKKIITKEHIIDNVESLLLHNETIKLSIRKLMGKEIMNWTNYLLVMKRGCIYKLDNKEYSKLKDATNHSEEPMLSSYDIYLLVLFLGNCCYFLKCLYILFPKLKKYDVFLTVALSVFPLYIYYFFYFYFNGTYVILTFSFCILFMLFSNKYYFRDKRILHPESHSLIIEQKRIYTFLLEYRIYTMNIVYTCIFAVDFFHFPKHLAKSHSIGNTLMDIGIGSCIFSSSFLSRWLKTKKDVTKGTEKEIKGVREIKGKTKRKLLPKLNYLVLFLLGIARFILIKFFNYQVNINEYGYHWNFFLTLCFLFLICDSINTVVKKKFHLFLLSCFSICLYEAFIHYYNIQEYIFKEERSNFFSLNKEGLFNLIGSINLYLLASSIGAYVMDDILDFDEWNESNRQSTKKEMMEEKNEENVINEEEKVEKEKEKEKEKEIENEKENENENEKKKNAKGKKQKIAEKENEETIRKKEKEEKKIEETNNENTRNSKQEKKANGDKGEKKNKIKYQITPKYYFAKEIKKKYFSIYTIAKLSFLTFIFYFLHLLLDSYQLHSVRILSNMNYVFLVMSVNLCGILIFYASNCTLLEKPALPTFLKLNKNTLFIFLFCNICMGIFNLLFQTLLFPLILTFSILCVYSFIFVIFATFL